MLSANFVDYNHIIPRRNGPTYIGAIVSKVGLSNAKRISEQSMVNGKCFVYALVQDSKTKKKMEEEDSYEHVIFSRDSLPNKDFKGIDKRSSLYNRLISEARKEIRVILAQRCRIVLDKLISKMRDTMEGSSEDMRFAIIMDDDIVSLWEEAAALRIPEWVDFFGYIYKPHQLLTRMLSEGSKKFAFDRKLLMQKNSGQITEDYYESSKSVFSYFVNPEEGAPFRLDIHLPKYLIKEGSDMNNILTEKVGVYLEILKNHSINLLLSKGDPSGEEYRSPTVLFEANGILESKVKLENLSEYDDIKY